MSISMEALAMAGVDYVEWGMNVEEWEQEDSELTPPHLLAEEKEEEEQQQQHCSSCLSKDVGGVTLDCNPRITRIYTTDQTGQHMHMHTTEQAKRTAQDTQNRTSLTKETTTQPKKPKTELHRKDKKPASKPQQTPKHQKHKSNPKKKNHCKLGP
ncbi:hypothetical protein QYF36_000797 [Acer negundo]|nr:hypothetical protein QYF36_000797 [Acer negundo]